jgi:hypothetical protein
MTNLIGRAVGCGVSSTHQRSQQRQAERLVALRARMTRVPRSSLTIEQVLTLLEATPKRIAAVIMRSGWLGTNGRTSGRSNGSPARCTSSARR